MRFCLLLACLSGALSAAEPSPAPSAEPWPLWDGKETPAEYGQRVGLPPTKTLDLGNGVTLECVLIPAGTFIMGTPEPVPVDEESFRKRVVTGQALVAASAGVLLVLLTVVVLRAIRRKSWPQVSLGRLLALTAVTAFGIWGGLHWRQAAQDRQHTVADFEAAKARYADANDNEKPAHFETLTKPFYMGKYEVTQAQFERLLIVNPSKFQGTMNPVDSVHWDDAAEFCRRASEMTGERVGLPTESELEYACRAGTNTNYWPGDNESDLARAEWYEGNSGGTTHPVGEKEANAFGLYDMHGNVSEWCSDYIEDYRGRSRLDIILVRQRRGGAWSYSPTLCRSTTRISDLQRWHLDTVGFRVVVKVPPRAP